MGRPSEKILIQKHAIEFIREAAKLQEGWAFGRLQTAQTEFEQYDAAEEMELWKSVQILIEQRDKLQKYVRLLIKAEGEETTANAAEEYLEEIGIEL